mgnify:CR=1 FL=1
MNTMEKSLKQFFSQVGDTHATNVLQDVHRYVPLMKRYPEIAEQEIYRFEHYFTDAPANNHPAALECLIVIARQVPQVRPRIIEKIGSILYEYLPLWKGLPEYDSLSRLLKILELPISEGDKYLRALARSVTTLRKPMILIIGAGFSYDVMPITNELQPLLTMLLHEVGVPSPTKMISEDDEQVWRIAKENSVRFKDMFSGWCAKMHPSFQHKIAARMLHDGQISHLISFNWDDLVERAYMDAFGQKIPKVIKDGNVPEEPSLWKLHGDVEDLSGGWVFPYQTGRVFGSLIKSLDRTVDQNCPQFALIVGYSEWEEVVRERLIKWLEGNIPTLLRVRPNWDAKNAGGMKETAKRFFERLNIYFDVEAKSGGPESPVY